MHARVGLLGSLFALTSVACATAPRAAPDVMLGSTHVDAHGAEIGALHIGVSAIGRDTTHLSLASHATLERSGGTVEITHAPGVVEWWREVAGGLEQGVTLAERPDGDGLLALEIETGAARADALGPDALALLDEAGHTLARYTHLSVIDADGARVPATMRPDGARIRIEVDDAGARYPLVVDPLVIGEEASLVSSTLVPSGAFGRAVAIDATGTRAIVGAPNEGANAGSARVFLRSGSLWTEETRVSVGTGTSPRRGTAVAISGDGNRIMEGSPTGDGAGTTTGGAYVIMRRDAGSWVPEVSGSAPGTNYRFGESVALDADGDVAVVGISHLAPGAFDCGAIYVLGRSGTTWSSVDTVVGSRSGGFGDEFGLHVAVSGDGNYVMVSDSRTHAYVYERQVMVPRNQYPETVLYDGSGTGQQVAALAIDATGTRALVGIRTSPGSVRVFVRSGSTWTLETTLSNGATTFGTSVSISADGARALIGETDGTGAVRLYVRSGATWTADATGLASDRAPGDGYGASVSLAADGTRAVVGAPTDTVLGATSAGSARVLTIRRPNGDPCTSADQCGSGSCADGYCCDLYCGAGATDCEACAMALTGMPNGTCAPLTAALAPSVACRPATGSCDLAETCTSTSRVCPTNVVRASGDVCRAATGACDAPEVCNGADGVCPGDVRAAPGTPCRPPAGPCDLTEVCDGANGTCPPDALLSAAFTCRNSVGPCDVADLCDGSTALCPDRLAASGTICNAFLLGPCDAPDTCTGTSADCMPEFLAGVECRPSFATCDVAETCTGASVACPPDAVAAAGLPCRVAGPTACDVTETCDGIAATCPADVPVCELDAGARDGGVGPAPDGGGTTDAGGGAVVAASSCRASPRAASAPWALLLGALALVLRRRP